MLNITKIKLTPNFIFISGQLLFLIPLSFSQHRIFDYAEYSHVVSNLWLHGLAIFCFVLFSSVTMLFINKTKRPRAITVPIGQTWFYVILLLMTIVLQVIVYKGVPAVSIIFGGMTIQDANDLNAGSGGLLGLVLVIQLFLLFIFPIINYKRKWYKYVVTVIFILSSLVALKRQLLFYFLFTMTIYSGAGYVTRRMVYFSIFFVLLFLIIGSERAGQNILDPIITYLAFPLINETNYILGIDIYRFGFQEFASIFSVSLPHSLLGFIGGDAIKPSLTFPSAGLGAVGSLVVKSGIVGLMLYYSLISIYMNILWAYSRYDKFYLLIYSFSAWPLFSSSTYNHFQNLIFYILPMSIFLIFYIGSRRVEK